MILNFKNLPISSLPYNDINLCKQAMLKLYENIPYLPELPLIDANDNLIQRTIANLPCIKIVNSKIIFPEQNSNDILKSSAILDNAYNSENLTELDKFASTSVFWQIYLDILAKNKPKYTVIKLLGAFSLADLVSNHNTIFLFSDKQYRKFIIQAICVKALWFIHQIKTVSPETTPIFIFDEQYLYKFSTYKRMDESFTKDSVVTLFIKIFQKIKKSGGMVGIQSFEKCNWMLAIEANADIISFDAYANSASLSIIGEQLGQFLKSGGYINWAIVPSGSENLIKGQSIDILTSKLKSSMETVVDSGVPLDLLMDRATVSVQGNLSDIPIIFAEKALMLANTLSKRFATT